MRAILLAAVFCLACKGAAAETVSVRSGEHDGFTRLVLQLPPAASWSLARTESGYLLKTQGAEVAYDTARTFDYITRDRIGAVRTSPEGLAIALACECHAITSETSSGLLVIDVKDGPGNDPLPVNGKPAAGATPDLSHFWLDRLPAPAESKVATDDPALPSEPETEHDRLDAAAHLLEWQLSRAMGQGLVDPAQETPAAELLPPDSRADGPDMPVTEELGVSADTAMDKVFREPRIPRGFIQDCPAPEDFAITSWADDRAFGQQIAEAMGGLLGEFDAPDRESILKAARLYLHFGMGPEAADLIRSFDLGPDEDHHLAALAEVIEGNAGPENPLVALECEGDVLLWRILANPGALTSGRITTVLNSFSALPPHLRKVLGPRLIDLLLQRGDADAARSVRDAMLRGSQDGQSPTLVDITIALADPTARPDPVALVQQLAQQGENMPRSVILVIDAYQRRDIPVPTEISDLAETLAFENREGAWGPDLRQALARALASQGMFVEAFAQLEGDSDVPAWFFAVLAAKSDDIQFLQLVFDRMSVAMTVQNVENWNALGTRLVDLGFPREASGFLRRPAQTDADHLLAARIAAAEGRPDEALAEIRDLTSEEAEALRKVLAAARSKTDIAHETSSEPPASASGNPPVPGPGVLGTTRALLQRSAADRKALEALVQGPAKP